MCLQIGGPTKWWLSFGTPLKHTKNGYQQKKPRHPFGALPKIVQMLTGGLDSVRFDFSRGAGLLVASAHDGHVGVSHDVLQEGAHLTTG